MVKTYLIPRRLNILPKVILGLFLCLTLETSSPLTALAKNGDSPRLLQAKQLAPIASIVNKAIRSGQIHGAVVVIGNEGKIVYRKAFGYRAVEPKKLPMKIDTVFDLASLTKVVATATAVMQLSESGKLNIQEPVTKYWPEFGSNGKQDITVLELLTHYSGIRPDLRMTEDWSGYDTAIRKIIAEKPIRPPNTSFIYSDVNFIILGELVRRISGEPLDVYCANHIFRPLGMKDTLFNPPASLRNRIAPTQYLHGNGGKMLWGEVHDPTAYRMGGIAGDAGLFSTADDLAKFVRMLLAGGGVNKTIVLSPRTVEMMSMPQGPSDKLPLRGLGWNVDSPFSSNRGELPPVGSFGHTGFTGTSIQIDPITKTFVIILTNRVHPNGKGNVKQLRCQIAQLVSDNLGLVTVNQVLASRPSLSTYFQSMKEHQELDLTKGKVQTGIDVLESDNFSLLSGLRIGLITNQTGLDSEGRRTVDVLYKAPGIKLTAIFSPEHGLSGQEDTRVASSFEPSIGVPVYSLYGDVKRPTQDMLDGLDALVFDVQDVGVRFYTYVTTMAYAMEAAAKKGIAFYVLDRPNPITGSAVEGPVMDKDLESFVGYFPLPLRHGMTVGELARMFNVENKIRANLQIVKMHGYKRTYWYDETGLPWINPSPNLRSLNEAILYPGVALAEGSNVSVGRGTDTPFELLGAPWINAEDLSRYLNKREISGVRFVPVDFTPRSSPFRNQACHGIKILLADRQLLDPAVLGVDIISALYSLYPKQFQIDKTLSLVGSRSVLKAIKNGQDTHCIVTAWQQALGRFLNLRSHFLLY
ncbi:MAG: exo-beta-N-acetylmuramidase NamZ domain-containing protein [Dissulfurispiraceae bacterium]